MMQLEMLPAEHGDALLLEYGDARERHRILVDAGPASSYESVRWRLLALPPGHRRFELLVITHVDADHIEGVIKLLQDDDLGCEFADVWFNDYRHARDPEKAPDPRHLGAVHGEILAALLQRPGVRWNAAFDGARVAVADDGPLPERMLAGGLRLTVLGPGRTELETLATHWNKVVGEAGFAPGDVTSALAQLERRKWLGPPRAALGEVRIEAPKPDNSVANGSSICVLAEFDGHRLLLSGDAFASTMEQGVRRWLAQHDGDTLALDAFKLPHHGSRANLSPELLDLLRCRRYLVSTSGARFGHPDAAAMRLVLEHHQLRAAAVVQMNYATQAATAWIAPAREDGLRFEVLAPAGSTLGLYARTE